MSTSPSIRFNEIRYIRNMIEERGTVTVTGYPKERSHSYYKDQRTKINKAYKNKRGGHDKSFEIFTDDLRKINLAETIRENRNLDEVFQHTEFVLADKGMNDTFIEKVFEEVKDYLKKETDIYDDKRC